MSLGASYFNLSVTPAYGLVRHHHPDVEALIPGFLDRTLELVSQLAERADKAAIKLSLRNEYWSLLRGEAIERLLGRAGERRVRRRYGELAHQRREWYWTSFRETLPASAVFI